MSTPIATAIGSMPGGDVAATSADNLHAYDEALRIVVGELPNMVAVPELPNRGAAASMTGRTLGLVTEMAADLQPFGWRLTSSVGVDQRRAASLLAQDLDRVEEQLQEFAGVVKSQVAGPWTLAATVERPRGGKVLADHGARRDLASALAEAVGEHVNDLRRRVPKASEIVIQLDEPALPAVLAAQVPTVSGWGRHRGVAAPEASAALELLCEAIGTAGATPIVHCCAPRFPISLVRGAGARGIAVDLEVLDPVGYDELAAALEAGDRVLLGAVPTRGTPPEHGRVTERVLRVLDMLGLEPTENLVVTPACGLAGATLEAATMALRTSARVAANLS